VNPDLKAIYDDLVSYTSQETLMGQNVDIRVEDDIYIKLYVNDEGGIKGQFKKPMMVINFSQPGVLTVKFMLLDQSKFGYISEKFKLIQLGKDAFRIDFEKLENFEHFIGSL